MFLVFFTITYLVGSVWCNIYFQSVHKLFLSCKNTEKIQTNNLTKKADSYFFIRPTSSYCQNTMTCHGNSIMVFIVNIRSKICWFNNNIVDKWSNCLKHSRKVLRKFSIPSCCLFRAIKIPTIYYNVINFLVFATKK